MASHCGCDGGSRAGSWHGGRCRLRRRRVLARCRERGWKGIGFDLSAGAVKHAQERQLDVRLAGWPPCDLRDGSVQVVACINVLDHLPDPFAAMAEAYRILAPGGLLYLRVPNGPLHAMLSRWSRMAGLPDLSIQHLYGFGALSLRFHLARLGFDAGTIRTSPPTQSDAYCRSRTYGARLRGLCKRADLALYRCAQWLGVDRVPYGLSLEALARKPLPAAGEGRL
ncbi:MAG: class I SAM-dependent methyltransferase [Nitrospiraceae bacterium]